MAFGTDSVQIYDVDPWNGLGFGVPTFGGDNVATLNRPLHSLTDEIGKLQLFLMTHIDASRHQPPSKNTIQRLGKLVNRCQAVLAGRKKEYNESRLEEGHASPSHLIWNIHPVPYFTSHILKNKWLKEYNDLLMILLTNAYQHSDNALALTITSDLAKDLYQYVREIKLRLGTELLNIDIEDLKKDSFQFGDSHYDKYAPEIFTTRIESLDRATSVLHLPTEDDLYPLLVGIPATIILPNLKPFPIGIVPGATGQTGLPTPDSEVTPGFPGAIGEPSV